MGFGSTFEQLGPDYYLEIAAIPPKGNVQKWWNSSDVQGSCSSLTEWTSLEKIFEIIKANLWPNTSSSSKPWHWVPWPVFFKHMQDGDHTPEPSHSHHSVTMKPAHFFPKGGKKWLLPSAKPLSKGQRVTHSHQHWLTAPAWAAGAPHCPCNTDKCKVWSNCLGWRVFCLPLNQVTHANL